MKSGRLWRSIIVALLAAVPAGGFLLGLLNPGDPDPNPLGRMVYACMMAALTPWHAGFPPRGGVGAGQSFNAWPHIAGAFLVIVAWLIYRDSKRAHRGDSASSLKQDEGAS